MRNSARDQQGLQLDFYRLKWRNMWHIYSILRRLLRKIRILGLCMKVILCFLYLINCKIKIKEKRKRKGNNRKRMITIKLQIIKSNQILKTKNKNNKITTTTNKPHKNPKTNTKIKNINKPQYILILTHKTKNKP